MKNKEEISDAFRLRKLKKANLFIIRDFSATQKSFLSLKSLTFEDSIKKKKGQQFLTNLSNFHLD